MADENKTSPPQGDADSGFSVTRWFKKQIGRGDAPKDVTPSAKESAKKPASREESSGSAKKREEQDISVLGVPGFGDNPAPNSTQYFRKQFNENAATGNTIIFTADLAGEHPKDLAEAAAMYRTAAEKGDTKAQFKLGLLYLKGEGVPQDFVEAVRWLRKAAEAGDAMVQYQLAVFYEKGRGVPPDLDEAARWYKKAADQGLAIAQHKLSSLQEKAAAVAAPGATTSADGFLLAAQQGVSDAQLKVGMMCLQGTGT
ncbi:MAG TPA: tetratricopeptide repeat protein, partial [Verrucomicrobiae bacterium]|nr:tetratricopeptide repeat protein [Verrucomicrobiae bacterium]